MILISNTEGLTVGSQVLNSGNFFKADKVLEEKITNGEFDDSLYRLPEQKELVEGFAHFKFDYEDMSQEQKQEAERYIEKLKSEVKDFLDGFKKR